MGVSPAAGQGQRHPADASLRYEGLQLCCDPQAVSVAGECLDWFERNCESHLEMHEVKVILSVILATYILIIEDILWICRF